MRAFLLLVAASLLAITTGCDKTPDFEDDFGGTGLLRGRLTYTDRFAGGGASISLANRTVRLAQSPSDQVNFKYSVATDKDGNFLFEHLNPDVEYDVFFNDTIQKVRYAALKKSKPTDNPFFLEAKNDTVNQNGFAFTLVDSRPAGAAPVANASLCVFNNRLTASADTCLGSIFTIQTDNFGRATRYNLRSSMYYFFGIVRLAGQSYRVFDSVRVNSAGIAQKNSALKPYSRRRNGFDLSLIDRRSTPLANAQVCVFNSAVLARVDTCAGSIYQFQSDPNGRVQAFNLVPQRYYFRITGRYGALTLKAYDSLNVQPNGVSSRTIQLR